MVNLLVSILSPILGPMGVSSADLSGYITALMGYVTVILAVLVIVIAVMIAAHFVKKGSRALVRVTALVLGILMILYTANQIIYSDTLYSTVSTYVNGSGVEIAEETVAASKDIIKEVGEEGLVLVKNDGLLPLSSDTKALNVFGWDSTNPLFGGTGSGSSDGSSAVGIIQSLQDAGYSTNEDLTQMYKDYCAERPSIAMAAQDWTLPEPTKDYYTSDLMSQAEDFSDVAVLVIGRSGGEGADLPDDMYAVIHGTYDVRNEGKIAAAASENYGYTNATYTNNGSYDDFDEGETYLELSNTEEDMIDVVCNAFDKVIVVINANNTMELSWVDEYDSIGAVILAPGTGNTGMAALGEIINGSVNPSGKTTDTFVRDLTATPTFNNKGNFTYDNTAELQDNIASIDSAYEGNASFVNYVEGIYVGYKFYETAADEGLIDYDSTVQYPFGYGLSYTTFDEEITDFTQNDDSISMTVKVTNTGSTAGKDVVEVYYNPPYTNGGIEKASVNLIDFAKTDVLEAGASTEVSFEIALEDMASYDSECIVTSNGGYVLEEGTYEISVRSDSHTVLASETFTVGSTIDYSSTGRSSDNAVATNVFEDYTVGTYTQLSRADGFANYDEATAAPSVDAYVLSDDALETVTAQTTYGYKSGSGDDASAAMPTTGATNNVTVADLTGLAYDDAKWDDLLDELTTDQMIALITYGGWSTQAIDTIGLYATSDCDGPAGLSNFITGAYGTAYPSEVLMAQTWNTELIERMGEAMGQEYADADNYGWYGPAMNTHRSAFAGRNFEYYSEDGVLAGKLATAEINGAAKKGVYAYIKHFALNDQETNRCTLLMTYATEQAIREIYLKPFEICVKNFDGNSIAVMSSFNWIGTKPACANSDLLNTVLRGEWGFEGFVCTDYDGSYGYMVAENVVNNGGDLFLGFGNASNPANPNALPFDTSSTPSASLVTNMRTACHNIIYTIANSGYYTNPRPVKVDVLANLMKTINISVIVVCVALEALVVALWIKSRKKKQEQK